MHHGVTGLKKNDTIKEIMTRLAKKIHPNDHAFVELVSETWSRKQNVSDQPKKRFFNSDLGNDVDQDVLEYCDEEEKKEFSQVKEAAKRRIKESAGKLHTEIVEGRAKFQPKKRKQATKTDKSQKCAKTKPETAPKKERKKHKYVRNKKLSGAEICKRTRQLAIADVPAVVHDQSDLLQIVSAVEAPTDLPPHSGMVPADPPSQLNAEAEEQSLPKGAVPADQSTLNLLEAGAPPQSLPEGGVPV